MKRNLKGLIKLALSVYEPDVSSEATERLLDSHEKAWDEGTPIDDSGRIRKTPGGNYIYLHPLDGGNGFDEETLERQTERAKEIAERRVKRNIEKVRPGSTKTQSDVDTSKRIPIYNPKASYTVQNSEGFFDRAKRFVFGIGPRAEAGPRAVTDYNGNILNAQQIASMPLGTSPYGKLYRNGQSLDANTYYDFGGRQMRPVDYVHHARRYLDSIGKKQIRTPARYKQ